MIKTLQELSIEIEGLNKAHDSSDDWKERLSISEELRVLNQAKGEMLARGI